jgi:3-dehydroquinate synthase
MRTIELKTASRLSRIHVGAGFGELGRWLPVGRTIIITDQNVLGLYRDELPAFAALSIGAGEDVKSLSTAQELYEALVDLEADRSTFILGVGGGVVCDMAGFVASTFMRGLRFAFAATTLLAQVDASVGGKNGLNLLGYKNIIGTFSQPEFVLCDPSFLRTLPEAEVANGMAEIVKHALIADGGMFAFLEENAGRALALEHSVIERLVGDSVVIKAGIVGRDEREAGERRKLNFGHTFGHALEKTAGLSHGEAVSVGMALAAAISVRRGMLSPESFERMCRLLKSLRLPGSASAPVERVVDAIRKDKKRAAQKLHMVLLEDIGRAAITEIDLDELTELASGFPEILRRRPSDKSGGNP